MWGEGSEGPNKELSERGDPDADRHPWASAQDTVELTGYLHRIHSVSTLKALKSFRMSNRRWTVSF